MTSFTQLDVARRNLIDVLVRMGYPAEFGELIAGELGGENSIRRMTGYLLHAHPNDPDEIVDEMLAICSDRDRWREKKENEYYASRYYTMMRGGFEREPEPAGWSEEEEDGEPEEERVGDSKSAGEPD